MYKFNNYPASPISMCTVAKAGWEKLWSKCGIRRYCIGVRRPAGQNFGLLALGGYKLKRLIYGIG